MRSGAAFHRHTHGPTQEPLHDYRTTGWKVGRDPSAEFSTSGNLEDRPDVAEAGLNPLVHHAIFRRFRQRDVLAEAHEQSEEGWVPWPGSKGIDNGHSGRIAVSSFGALMRDVCKPRADGDDFAPYRPDIAQSLDVMRDLAGQREIDPEKARRIQTLVAPGIRHIISRAIGAVPDEEFEQWFRVTGGEDIKTAIATGRKILIVGAHIAPSSWNRPIFRAITSVNPRPGATRIRAGARDVLRSGDRVSGLHPL
ncbi:hypothetical protein LA6_001683 [Marinibacterium anthonyi]|nr:hypothetical protein LA6_001683 [Marinibacterium anthonyi]